MLSLFTIDNLLDELVYKQLRNFRLGIDYDGIILLIIFLNKSAACKPPTVSIMVQNMKYNILCDSCSYTLFSSWIMSQCLFRDNDVAGISMCPP